MAIRDDVKKIKIKKNNIFSVYKNMALLTFKLKGMEGHPTRSSDATKTGGFSSIWTTAKHPMVTINRKECPGVNEYEEQVESTNMLVNGAVYEFCKFFPYDNGKGYPIYNENTGRELRDPVTGEPLN